MTDPIADMLTRIRNIQMVKKTEVVLPYSKLKFNILKLMQENGWIKSVIKQEPVAKSKFKKSSKDYIYNRFATLIVVLKYDEQKVSKISSLKRISKPGRRVYVNKEEIPTVLNGKGMSIISTSQGLLTDKGARQKKIGGELICEIY